MSAEQPRLDDEFDEAPVSPLRPILQEEPPASAVMYRLGGRYYPVKSEARCNTCQSPHRLDVERKLLQGYSYRSIARDLPEDAGLTERGISAHVSRGHLPLNEQVKRAAIEERARELGHDIERFDKSLVDAVSFARLGIQDVWERMQSGELKPTIKDGIQFARLLHDIGLAERDEVGADAAREVFSAYMDAFVQVVTDPEQQREFANALSSHPVMRSWLDGYRAGSTEEYALEEGDVEEAELVEDEAEEAPAST